MSKDSIRLSEKHGVNPTIPICFFCGEEKPEIALLGKLKNDEEAPRNAVINYEPCDNCKALMEQGITLIEATEQPIEKGMPPISNNAVVNGVNKVSVYPTGRWVVLKEEAFKKIFDVDMSKDEFCFVDSEMMDMLLNNGDEQEV